jgi:hypothetical protein
VPPGALTAIRDRRGDLLALVSDEGAWLSPAIEPLESDHPRRRFAAMLCLVAHLMQTGEDREPYDPEIARYYARYILIPDTLFILHSSCESDSRLAERFNVPLEQIAAKRADIGLRGLDTAA